MGWRWWMGVGLEKDNLHKHYAQGKSQLKSELPEKNKGKSGSKRTKGGKKQGITTPSPKKQKNEGTKMHRDTEVI